MSKFFDDMDAFRKELESRKNQEGCWSCGEHPDLLLTVPVAKDFGRLGVPLGGGARIIDLCPACAARYMNSSNGALSAAQGRVIEQTWTAERLIEMATASQAGAGEEAPPNRDREDARFERLQKKLLALGGARVVRREELYLDQLLARGRVFPAQPSVQLPGDPSQCHANVALHYLQLGGAAHIVTGYALVEDDGGWVQHSWLWDGQEVLETTVPRDLYFGVILSQAEAAQFVLDEVTKLLPGFQELMGQSGRKRARTQKKTSRDQKKKIRHQKKKSSR
jgi:hypothetical protein